MPSTRGPIIRKFTEDDEKGWVRCRVLAFLNSAYYDDVYREKEHYESQSIELVAEAEGEVVGLIDIECETEPHTICSRSSDGDESQVAGMIWHLAVHPDFRRQGIAKALLQQAIEQSRELGLSRLEAWTRNDGQAEIWYQKQGFQRAESYYHVYMDSSEMVPEIINAKVPGLNLRSAFAHYSGDDTSILTQFKRVYRCSRYDLILKR
ncbi:MAG: GNAT family N-acetyltransferase [Candidatus Thorarchaeota archaeon]